MKFKLFYLRSILFVAEVLNKFCYKLNMYVHNELGKDGAVDDDE